MKNQALLINREMAHSADIAVKGQVLRSVFDLGDEDDPKERKCPIILF